uniref:Uncharacterized protein n=1 Tax=Octopus bimaculoides TaxID=37653 RepID=A0A0L8I684_OCTBM
MFIFFLVGVEIVSHYSQNGTSSGTNGVSLLTGPSSLSPQHSPPLPQFSPFYSSRLSPTGGAAFGANSRPKLISYNSSPPSLGSTGDSPPPSSVSESPTRSLNRQSPLFFGDDFPNNNNINVYNNSMNNINAASTQSYTTSTTPNSAGPSNLIIINSNNIGGNNNNNNNHINNINGMLSSTATGLSSNLSALERLAMSSSHNVGDELALATSRLSPNVPGTPTTPPPLSYETVLQHETYENSFHPFNAFSLTGQDFTSGTGSFTSTGQSSYRMFYQTINDPSATTHISSNSSSSSSLSSSSTYDGFYGLGPPEKPFAASRMPIWTDLEV